MISREYPDIRKRYARAIRSARKRAAMARKFVRVLAGLPVFLSPAEMLRVSFATPGIMEKEVEWLKNYEQGEFNAETEE